MALWVCAACTCRYSVGAPCCPQCRSTEREGEQVPKIRPDGRVSYEPGREPGGPRVHPGYGEPMEGVEHPADGTWSPPVDNGGGEVSAAVTVIPPEGEPPDPMPGPGQGQDSTPPPSSPGSSVPPDESAAPKPAPARAPRKADVDV